MQTDIVGRTRRRRYGAAFGITLAIGVGGLIGAGSGAAVPEAKVTLCHATGSVTNPYVLINVAAAAAYNGHLGDGHQSGEDIIPPFMYKGTEYRQNWPAGQEIFDNGCFKPRDGGLGIQKTGPEWVLPGGYISYTIAIRNFGEDPVKVADVTVKDPSANVTPPAQESIAGGGIAFWTAVSKKKVRRRSCGRDIKNTASVSLPDDKQRQNGESSNTSTWTTNVVCPQLSIKKASTNGPVAPGGTATYDIAVINTGKYAVPFAVVNDNLVDEGATVTPPEDQSPIEPGAENARVWTASVPVPPLPETTCGGKVSNTATISLGKTRTALKRSTGVGESPLTSTAFTDVECPVDVTVAKTTASSTVLPGGTVPYTITVTNPSAFAVPFSAIAVSDDGATIVPPADTTDLAAGASRTWSATKVAADGTAACGTTVANTAQVTLSGLPAGYRAITPAGVSSTASPVTIGGGICDAVIVPQGQISAAARAVLSVRKSGPAIARRGSGVTYRIRVTNSSTVTATDVVITDTPPGALRIAGTSPGATRQGRTISWAIGDLAAGASRTVSVMLGVRATASGTTCNVAAAAAGNADSARGKACTRVQTVRRVIVTG